MFDFLPPTPEIPSSNSASGMPLSSITGSILGDHASFALAFAEGPELSTSTHPTKVVAPSKSSTPEKEKIPQTHAANDELFSFDIDVDAYDDVQKSIASWMSTGGGDLLDMSMYGLQ